MWQKIFTNGARVTALEMFVWLKIAAADQVERVHKCILLQKYQMVQISHQSKSTNKTRGSQTPFKSWLSLTLLGSIFPIFCTAVQLYYVALVFYSSIFSSALRRIAFIFFRSLRPSFILEAKLNSHEHATIPPILLDPWNLKGSSTKKSSIAKNLIFGIVMGCGYCGIAHFGWRGLKTT